MVKLSKKRNELKKEFPNLVDYEAKALYRTHTKDPMPEDGDVYEDIKVKRGFFGLGNVKRIPYTRTFQRSSEAAWEKRKDIRIAIPRRPQYLEHGADVAGLF